MKLLDELEHEQARHRAPRRGGGAPMAAQPACDAARCALEALYTRLAELAEGLNRLDIDVRVDFDIPRVGTLEHLRQGAYRVADEDEARPAFTFAFDCVGDAGLKRVLRTAGERDLAMAQLESLDVPFNVDSLSSFRFAVLVKPVVPVRLVFSPSRDGQNVRMSAWNLNCPGEELFTIRPGQVSDEFVEETGRFVLRRENRFLELTGNRLSPESRANLAAGLKVRRPRPTPPASHGSSSRPAAVRRQAPIMTHERNQPDGWVNWKADTPAPRTAPAAETAPGAGFHFSRHAWIITWDHHDPDADASVARRGPPGTAVAFPSATIVSKGQGFRLLDEHDRVCYRGMILGSYRGTEPLTEFGVRHGCQSIELLHGERWVAPAGLDTRSRPEH